MADPITLLGLGLAASGAAGVAGSLVGGAKPPPVSLPGQAPPAQSPTGSSSTFKQTQPSFLSAAAATPQQQNPAQKTLLGQ